MQPAPRLRPGVGWETLIALADEHEQADMVTQFSLALQQERKHQVMIQTWYEEAVGLSDAARARADHRSTAAARATTAASTGVAMGVGAAPVAPPGSTS